MQRTCGDTSIARPRLPGIEPFGSSLCCVTDVTVRQYVEWFLSCYYGQVDSSTIISNSYHSSS